MEHMLACERLGACRVPGAERRDDRAVLVVVPLVERVRLRAARSPHRVPGERTARALRQALDQRRLGDPVDHVVEAVIRVHPLVGEPPAVLSLVRPRPERLRRLAERLLGQLELA
jgi:hypothetical protein